MNPQQSLLPPIPPICNSNTSRDNVRTKQQQPKDQEARELLVRIENVAETWCVALLQQKQIAATANNQGHERIMQFCLRTLQEIVASSQNRRKKAKHNIALHSGNSDAHTTAPDAAVTAANPYVSPQLQSIALPAPNLLPGTVLALHYWYHQVARRCQYRESVLYFAGLLTSPATHGDPRAQQQYVQVCERQARLALSVQQSASCLPSVTTAATTTIANLNGNAFVTPLQDPEGINYNIVNAANFCVQQCLSTRATTTMTNAPPEQQTHHHHHHNLLNHQLLDQSSPQSVVLLDHQNCWVPAIVPQLSPIKTQGHPAPVKMSIAKNISMIEQIVPVPSASEMLASLYHASRCPHPPDDEEPCFFENCAPYKSLWAHIVMDNDCKNCKYENTQTISNHNSDAGPTPANGKEQQQQQQQHPCSTPHCLIAKQSLRHFRKCKKPSCLVCGPVMQLIPKLKQDMEQVQQQQTQLCHQVPTRQEQDEILQDPGQVHQDREGKVNGVDQNLKEDTRVSKAKNSSSDKAVPAAAAWTASTAKASPAPPPSPLLPLPSPSTSPLRRSALKRKSNRGPLKKRLRVKFASSGNHSKKDSAL